MFTKAIKRTVSGMPGILLFVSILVSTLFPSGFVSGAAETVFDGGSHMDLLHISDQTAPGMDWSKAMVESTMTRFTPSTIGGWSYPIGLYLHGQYLVYKRTGDSRYLQYIKSWADRFVSPSGSINNSFNNLDSMLSGIVLLDLYQETGQAKYKIAADKIRQRFNTYPRTSDGGFWHADSDSRAWQLWLDGTFMSMPFLGRYGHLFNDATYADNETTKQLIVYGNHLKDPSGLLYHAYDESGQASWADHPGNRVPYFWCRAIGWYGMANIEVLEVLPANHPNRPQLITMVQNMVRAFATYQSSSGRWFQIVDKGSDPNNWTETSCSSMFVYIISRAVERGYVDSSYLTVANKGYQGVLQRISLDPNGLTNLNQISVGTNASDSLTYYYDRTRATNDFHGLGAFLIMNEQMIRTGGGQATSTPTATSTATQPPGGNVYQAEAASYGGGVTIDSANAGFLGTGYANFPLSGGFVQFNNADGGTGGNATLRIRYALGVTTSRTGLLIVNGVSQNITFNPTGAWTAWTTQDVAVPLNAGTTNTIRFESNGQDLANLDQIQVILSGGPTNTPTATATKTSTPTATATATSTATQPPGDNIYQAEAASFGGGVTIDSANAGFLGTGYANFPLSGGFLQFNSVNGGTGGNATLRIRYALGVTTSRTGLLIVNGVSQNITFNPTGAWTTWTTQDVTVPLNSGTTNTIRFESNGQDLANIDQIEIIFNGTPTATAAVQTTQR